MFNESRMIPLMKRVAKKHWMIYIRSRVRFDKKYIIFKINISIYEYNYIWTYDIDDYSQRETNINNCKEATRNESIIYHATRLIARAAATFPIWWNVQKPKEEFTKWSEIDYVSAASLLQRFIRRLRRTVELWWMFVSAAAKCLIILQKAQWVFREG